jgi:hypothetical protein
MQRRQAVHVLFQMFSEGAEKDLETPENSLSQAQISAANPPNT